MSYTPILLVLGSGANIGASVAAKFAANGYKVALSSRTPSSQASEGVDLHIKSDLSNATAVKEIFREVLISLGPPTVVVYNAAAATLAPSDDPLALSIDKLNEDLQVNAVSVLAAAQEAKRIFDTLPPAASRTFIYTGNILNVSPIPQLLSLGIGKAASAHLIACAANAYSSNGYKFFYADERNADGTPAYHAISGAAHGEFYFQLANGPHSVPPIATEYELHVIKDTSVWQDAESGDSYILQVTEDCCLGRPSRQAFEDMSKYIIPIGSPVRLFEDFDLSNHL